ncbi:MAG: aminotransferase class IV [Xanthomonadales bacterium]|nr:aminotransferase class IV [Xanthomonadales bacterium]
MTGRMGIASLVDGIAADLLPVDDRGLAYGDGLFETIAFIAGRAPLWRGHMARLARGGRRLRLAVPAATDLLAQARQLAGADDCLIKIIVSRRGGRGYAPAAKSIPSPRDSAAGKEGNAVPADAVRSILIRHPLSDVPERVYQQGLRLRWCRLRLAAQPSLAGIKHLNRLEQVLARSEWRDPKIDEGLVCDADGRVISAVAANLFVVHDGCLLTPRIDRCGVAGVARAWLLAQARRWLPVAETDIDRALVESADELFLSNAVRGVMPVGRIGRRRLQPGPVTMRLGYTLAALGIGRPPGVAPQ